MDSRFLSALSATPLPNGTDWKLNEELVYQSSVLNKVITVPKNFITDFASVPKELWNIYPPWGVYGPAAVIHDWLYWDQSTTREEADDVLKEAMHILGVSSFSIQHIYRAVALFGGNGWKGDAERKASGYTRLAIEATPLTYPFATDPNDEIPLEDRPSSN